MTAATKKAVFPDYGNNIIKKMKSILDRDRLCDVVLIAGTDGKRIPAHRVILSSASEYFDAMFTGEMKEAKEKEITLNYVDGDILQVLVTYCYTGELDLNGDSVEVALATAHLLQLQTAVAFCAEFLGDQLSPSNCLGIQFFADQHECTELRDRAQLFASKHFKKVVQCEEFFQLTVNQLAKLLSRDDLKVTREEDIFRCIEAWVQRDKFNRKKDLPQLLPHVRLQFVDPKFISDHVESVCDASGCNNLIIEAYKSKLMPHLSGVNHKRRSFLEDYYLLVWEIQIESEITILKNYFPIVNAWTAMEDMTLDRMYTSFVVWKDKLIAVGKLRHGINYESLQYWDTEHMIWRQFAQLDHWCNLIHIIVLNGSLYALGGDKIYGHCNFMQRLDSLKGTWQDLHNLEDFNIHSSIAYDGSIFVEGIKNGISSLHRYNPNTNEWLHLGRTDGDIRGFVVKANELYAIRGDLVSCYNTVDNTWTICPTICPDIHRVCATGEHFFTMAKCDKQHKYILMEFDPMDNVWTELTSYPLEKYPPQGFITVPKSVLGI